MKQSRRQSSVFINIILFIGLVIIWIAFAPTGIGGQASYVIVSGISMEPGYHSGDLVILRKAMTYQIGEVATYRDPKMGSYVIHRIISVDQGQFMLKGDNNSWIDAYRPGTNEVIGKQWIHVPKLGSAMQWLRKPINLSITIVLLGGVFMTSMISKPPQNQKGKSRPSINLGGMLEVTLYALGLLLLGFIGLSIFAFTRPITRVADNIPYQQESNYFYSAAGTPGVYDTEMVRTGEPVFPALTCFLNIGLTYNILGGQLQDISGSHQMYARIMDEPSGWQRSIPLIPQTAFIGNSYFSTVSLDLCELTTLVTMVEAETGLHTNTYTVEIITDIAFAATASGQAVTDTLQPTLAFKFDKVHFYLATDGSGVDPLHFSKEGQAESSEMQANTLHILGLDPTVQGIRLASLLGLGFSLAALLVTGLYVYTTAGQGQDARIRLKYGAMLVDIQEQNIKPTASVIDITTIEDLARLAERHGTMILHMELNALHYYLVQGNEITYRYITSAAEELGIENEAIHNERAGYDTAPEDGPVYNHTAGYIVGRGENNLVHTQPVRAKTTEQATGNNMNNIIKFQPLEKKPSQQAIRYDENRVVNFETARRDLAEHPNNSHKNKVTDAGPVYRGTLKYVINSGEIGFVMPESTPTKIIREIRF